MRTCGVLMHITSLPSPYGVGTLGSEAYKFVDFLKKAGQTYWQILPVGPTGFWCGVKELLMSRRTRKPFP